MSVFLSSNDFSQFLVNMINAESNTNTDDMHNSQNINSEIIKEECNSFEASSEFQENIPNNEVVDEDSEQEYIDISRMDDICKTLIKEVKKKCKNENVEAKIEFYFKNLFIYFFKSRELDELLLSLGVKGISKPEKINLLVNALKQILLQ